MIDVFGNENPSIVIDGIELKPCRRYDRILPGYYVSQCAKIFSTKTNRFLQPNYRNKNSKDPNKAKIFRITIYVPIGFFDDYSHYTEEGKNVCQLTCDLHKLVIDSWKPLDDYTHEIDPPITKEEWNVLPPNVKTIIKESLVIDHIKSNDGTIECNHLNNLRRTTSTRNERSRKHLLLKRKLNLFLLRSVTVCGTPSLKNMMSTFHSMVKKEKKSMEC